MATFHTTLNAERELANLRRDKARRRRWISRANRKNDYAAARSAGLMGARAMDADALDARDADGDGVVDGANEAEVKGDGAPALSEAAARRQRQFANALPVLQDRRAGLKQKLVDF